MERSLDRGVRVRSKSQRPSYLFSCCILTINFVQPDWRKKYPGQVVNEEHLDTLEEGNTLPARLEEKRRLVYLDQAVVRQSVAREEARKSREKSIARSERSEHRRAKSKAAEAPVDEEEADQLAMDEVPVEELPETLQEEVPPVIGM